LGEFIKNYPERAKMKTMFMRETEAVYQFCTKRIAIKNEQNEIKRIFGGGFLSIDEFLDHYAPEELEKLERKDPLKRFSENISIQKKIVKVEAREASIVR
jgi:phosphosulfolactate synthase (CoM biosynthesis protein A)